MKQAGVWSFRTATGVARVVDGSLHEYSTLRGLLVGSYKQLGSGSVMRNLLVALGSVGAVGPIQDVVENVLAEGPVAGAVSAGLGALLVTAGTVVMLSVPVRSLLGRSELVDIYDIADVAVDADDCKLTIQHVDDNGDRETTTVEAADEEALGEAVSVLQLKGAPIDEALVEEWA